MKLIKLILVSVIVLFLLITCVGLLFPPTVTVMRSVNINAPEDSVYDMLNNISKWQYWMFDGARTPKILSSNTKGIHAQAQVGNSKITITHVTDSSIESVWETGKIHNQICDFVIGKNPQSPGTQVIWYFRQHLGWYPWERIGAVLNEKILGPSMDSAFARLKSGMEQ